MSTERRTPRAIAIALVALFALTALDLWTKALAEDGLSRERVVPVPVCTPNEHGQYSMQRVRTEPVVLVPDYLQLRYAENCGAAFGMLDEAPAWLRMTLFTSTAVGFITALFVMFVRGHGGPLFAWAVPFVVSGAAGNTIDRLRLGYVVDFIRFEVPGLFVWPTFNVADITIPIGMGLILLDGLRTPAPTAEPGAKKSERVDAPSR